MNTSNYRAVAVYVNVEITGPGAGTHSCPIHEVPVLADLIKQVANGERVKVLADWPAMIPRVRPMDDEAVAKEWERMVRRFGDYQVGEGIYVNFLDRIYSDIAGMAKATQRVFRLFNEAHQNPDEDQLAAMVEACRPQAGALLDVDTIEVGDLGGITSPAVAGGEMKPVEFDRIGLVKHLEEAGAGKETVDGLLRLAIALAAEGKELPPTIQAITDADITGIARNRERAGGWRRVIAEWAGKATAAVADA
jgi:hypothetical protein